MPFSRTECINVGWLIFDEHQRIEARDNPSLICCEHFGVQLHLIPSIASNSEFKNVGSS